MSISSIVLFLDKYFEVIQTQDLNLFDQVFHEQSMLYTHQDGVLSITTFTAYRNLLKTRQSAASAKYSRSEQILLIDMLSPSMALAKVRLKLFNNVMEDYLNLMQHDGKWMVYAKHPTKIDVTQHDVDL